MKIKVSYLVVVAIAGLSFVLGSLIGTRGSSAQVQIQRPEASSAQVQQQSSEGQLQRPGDSIEQQVLLPPAKSEFGAIGNMAFVVHVVEPDSPASRLGLQGGDLITGWNGKQIISIRDFLMMHQLEPGQPIEIEISRADFASGKRSTFSAKTLLTAAKY